MLFGTAPIGFTGERKAVALLCLAFYTAFYALMSLLMANAPPDYPELRAWWLCFAGLSACYGVGFFALGADWFWARWFAVGLGYSGLTMAGWAIVMQRTIEPVMLFYGLTHGLIALLLQGERMKDHFDAQTTWRERLHLDEASVLKVRQSVTRAAASLPTLIMIALAPRESPEGLLVLGAALVGFVGLVSLRTYGVLTLFGAGCASLLLLAHGPVAAAAPPLVPEVLVHGAGAAAAAFLLLSAAPFLRPMARFLQSR